ncbi:MAG: uracil-DNA glycosylase [Candidatus Buchananbacteria bacterium]|nr:uracil-DNA glycosylase [Candidatus Buchananbacteria bacterium]
MNKEEELQQLNRDFSQKIKSPLLGTCKQIVAGTGNAEADIMLIGEAPGKKEDETGEPFVGSAGKFLDQMLETISLKRKDIYITNIVKCRPPNNRDPLPEEKEEFWPWLMAQIKLIKPKLVVTLGRHSLSSFVADPIMSRVHGTILRKNIPELGRVRIYALYHPAAALYNGGMRETLIKDFKKIPKILALIEKGEI